MTVSVNGTHKFTGVHSKGAMNEVYAGGTKTGGVYSGGTKLNTGHTVEFEDVTPPSHGPDEVYRARIKVTTADGQVTYKSGNDAYSTFFPDSWNEARIKVEVEHAIKYNRGVTPGQNNPQLFFGYSMDGKTEIRFYFDANSSSVNSYFPFL